MDFSQWESGEFQTEELFLDSENARLSYIDKKLSQNELINELIQYDDVYNLAKNIVLVGYTPLENLLGIKQDKKVIIIEGNRRLSACKLLLNPKLAPAETLNKFQTLASKLKKDDLQSLTKLRVIIAPNRDMAISLLMGKHAKSPIEEWEPLMKANYVAKQISAGVSIDQLCNSVNISKSEIKDYILADVMYQKAKKVRLSGETKNTILNPRKFNMSTFIRIYKSPIGKKLFAYEFNKKGDKVLFRLKESILNKRIKQVVQDIALGVIDSRTLSKSSDIKEYLLQKVNNDLNNLENDKPKKSIDNIPNLNERIRKRAVEEEGVEQIDNNKIDPGNIIEPKSVFIVHGKDLENTERLKQILEKWKLTPIILMDKPGNSRTIIKKFEQEANRANYAFVLFSPDDLVTTSEGKSYQQPRPNVLFELGWFFYKLKRKRVVILRKRGTSIHSDIAGIEVHEFKESVMEIENKIKNELTSVGILEVKNLMSV